MINIKALKLNTEKDLDIIDGNLSLIEGLDEVRQSVERTLTTNTGEWFLDMLFGLNYAAIQGKGKDPESIRLAITEAILQDVRIAEADISIELGQDRRLLVSGTIKTTKGETLALVEVALFE